MTSHGPRGHVLIADRDPVVAGTVARELRRLSYEVGVATNGVDALAELHDAEFDVVIVDLDLPPRGGQHVLRVARQLSPDVEVIFTTSRSADDPADSAGAGAFEVLRRPVALDEVGRAVARAAEHRRLHTTTALYEACSAVGGTTAPERLPNVLVVLCLKALEADDVVLFLPHASGGLRVAHVAGSAPVDRVGRVVLADAALAEAASRPVVLPDAGLPSLAAAMNRAHVRSAIVHPLVAGEQLVGVLLASRTADPRPFRRPDLDRTVVLAAPILLALENARLMGRMLTSERLAAIGQLAAGVAHEINNPLTYIVGSNSYALDQLDLVLGLGDASDPASTRARLQALDEIRSALSDVEEGATRIGEIARDLTSMSRSSATASEIVDVSGAARSALRVTAAQLRQSANVVVDFADSASVVGSPGRLCQALVNLLLNAAQAAEGAPAPVDLFVSTAIEGDRVVATVRDTGPGIPHADLARLFDTFFTTKSAGTGLGLAVTRQIVEEMGGEISVESELGKGAKFTMTFAAAQSTRNVPMSARRSTDGQRMRLLFVDDDFPLLRCYERWFGRDHDVVTVQSPDRVLEILRNQADFTAIVSDVMMPGATGPELYARVAAEFPALASRFVLVTGASGNRDVRAWLASVPCPVFEKPLNVTALRAALLSLHHGHGRVA